MASAAATAPAASSFSSQPVRVVVRLRPFLPSETGSAATPCVSLIGGHPGSEVTVHLKEQRTSRSECYKLDAFFGHDDRVRDIFDKEVSAIIPGVFDGVNAAVFACGATGSGKTYTMQGTEDLPGIIPLAVSTVLKLGTGMLCSVEISYYEVYMGRCHDLLEPKDKEIMALDDQDGNLQLKGLAWVPVQSMEDFHEAYSKGGERRNVAHTGLNDVSNRSHAVLSIRVNNDGVTGKLNLIDLAGRTRSDELHIIYKLCTSILRPCFCCLFIRGNEDKTRICMEGIGSSLFALSNVISALKNNEQWIPYRDSKLTRILQDSLGGNSRAVLIACLNPMEYHESLYTVRLAGRSGRMKQPASSRVSNRAKVMNHDDGNIRKVLFDSVVPTAKNILRLSLQDEVKTRGIKKVILPSSTPCKEDMSELPLSKACSPNSSNMVIDDLDCHASLEPKTPIGACNLVGTISSATPLDKLNAHGSNLMESLVQKYLEFLNVASKEELQQVKGIGETRAEYIIELRKDSPRPFKSLSDMEKLGLSSKQVQGLVLKSATGIFQQSLERSVERYAGRDTSQHRRRIN